MISNLVPWQCIWHLTITDSLHHNPVCLWQFATYWQVHPVTFLIDRTHFLQVRPPGQIGSTDLLLALVVQPLCMHHLARSESCCPAKRVAASIVQQPRHLSRSLFAKSDIDLCCLYTSRYSLRWFWRRQALLSTRLRWLFSLRPREPVFEWSQKSSKPNLSLQYHRRALS